MKNLEDYSVKEMNVNALIGLDGGNFWGPFVLGWVASEIVQGVYQAQQKGFSCK